MKFDQRFVAKTFEGLEEVLSKELASLGGTDIEIINRAVKFAGDEEMLYKVNYNCHTALRILKPLAQFNASDQEMLYQGVMDIDWPKIFSVDKTFVINAINSYSAFTHSGFVGLKSKDAIVDRFRKELGKRPSVDTELADVRINIHIFRNRCTVSLDSSGDSLHLRNYRKSTGAAPLNEVLAAGMIALSGWDKESTFIDPMCGSGTLLTEAAMMAGNVPSGFFRKRFALKHWNDFDEALWERVIEESNAMIHTELPQIIGADSSRLALNNARNNTFGRRSFSSIRLALKDIKDFEPPEGGGTLITNPPYGERIELNDSIEFYKSFGDALKNNFQGYSAWVISSDLDALKHVGLRPSRKIKLFNGKLECRFVNFELYQGSKRVREEK